MNLLYNPDFHKKIDKETRKISYRLSKIARKNSQRRKKGGMKPEFRMLPLLVKEFSKCFWCDIEVVHLKSDGGKQPYYAASIDHVRSRYFREKGEEVLKVLSCYRCNAKRADEEDKKYGKEHILKVTNNI